MAVPQSCFEASVNALPWINVMCGISQEAAVPLQWQRQEARTQPKASHSYVRYKGCRFPDSLFLFITVCKVTQKQNKSSFDFYFCQKHKHKLLPFAHILKKSWQCQHTFFTEGFTYFIILKKSPNDSSGRRASFGIGAY